MSETDEQETGDEQEVEYPLGLDSLGQLRDAIYLVSRGVRPMALVGQVTEGDKDTTAQILRMAALDGQAGGLATLLPFMVEGEEGWYSCGYTCHRWVVDLYESLMEDCAGISWEARSQIMGMLLGYSNEAIGHFSTKSVEIRGVEPGK